MINLMGGIHKNKQKQKLVKQKLEQKQMLKNI